MLLTIDLPRAEALIEVPRVVREDRIVPVDFPEFPDSPYRVGYDWLFIYERRIARFLEKWLRPYRYELIGQKGILCEALSNAFSHGHSKDPHLPIFVKVVLGKQGLIVRIKDSGRGFNVGEVYQRYCKNEKYFYTAGNGLRLMSQSNHFGIFYNCAGTDFHLLYFFNRSMQHLPDSFIVTPHSAAGHARRRDRRGTKTC